MQLSVDQIERQMHDSIAAMTAKRNMLVTKLDTYKGLRQTALLLEKNSMMVHLGDEYFAEMPRTDAVRFLDRHITRAYDAISEINARIDESNKLLNQFKVLDTLETKNEDGLPVMDIVEELDDDDNVVHVTINNQKVETPAKTAQFEHKLKRIEELHRDDHQTESKKAAVIQQEEKLHSQPQQKDKTTRSIDPKKERIELIREDLDDQKPDNEDDQVHELLQDMGLTPSINRQDTVEDEEIKVDDVLERLDELEVDPEAKFQIKQKFLENLAKQEQSQTKDSAQLDRARQEVIADIVRENNLQINSDVSIDNSDMLELELLADDLQDENYDPGDDEWDFEFNDDDEEDDSYADSLLYGGSQFFKGEENSTANTLLFDQIHKMRTDKIEEPATGEADRPKKKNKKSVKFASELDIFEVEKIKKEDYIEPQRVSRFKQTKEYNRMSQKPNPGKPDAGVRKEEAFTANGATESVISDIVEQPMIHDVSEDLQSRQVTSGVMGDVFENPNDELRAMMVQYNNGEMVEKIDGPVIENLQDMEKLNKTLETMNIDEYEIEHEHDHGHEDSDGVLGDVAEKEVTVDQDLKDIIDQDSLDEQIKLDYIRLKEKINRVEEANEHEIEITNKPRVSRFKKNLAQNRQIDDKKIANGISGSRSKKYMEDIYRQANRLHTSEATPYTPVVRYPL